MIDKNEHADGTIHSHRQGAYRHIHKVGEPVPENTSTPSPVAPELKNPHNPLLDKWQIWEDCATAYKAHYDPIVEGLGQKLEDVSSMAARLFEDNTELQNKVAALESQLAQKQGDRLQEVHDLFVSFNLDFWTSCHCPECATIRAKLKEYGIKSLAPEKEKVKSGEPLEGGKG